MNRKIIPCLLITTIQICGAAFTEMPSGPDALLPRSDVPYQLKNLYRILEDRGKSVMSSAHHLFVSKDHAKLIVTAVGSAQPTDADRIKHRDIAEETALLIACKLHSNLERPKCLTIENCMHKALAIYQSIASAHDLISGKMRIMVAMLHFNRATISGEARWHIEDPSGHPKTETVFFDDFLAFATKGGTYDKESWFKPSYFPALLKEDGAAAVCEDLKASHKRELELSFLVAYPSVWQEYLKSLN